MANKPKSKSKTVKLQPKTSKTEPYTIKPLSELSLLELKLNNLDSKLSARIAKLDRECSDLLTKLKSDTVITLGTATHTTVVRPTVSTSVNQGEGNKLGTSIPYAETIESEKFLRLNLPWEYRLSANSNGRNIYTLVAKRTFYPQAGGKPVAKGEIGGSLHTNLTDPLSPWIPFGKTYTVAVHNPNDLLYTY